MSQKHNVKHPERGRSHYPARLAKRGLSKTPEMASLTNLRSRQAARVRETGVPYPGGPHANDLLVFTVVEGVTVGQPKPKDEVRLAA